MKPIIEQNSTLLGEDADDDVFAGVEDLLVVLLHRHRLGEALRDHQQMTFASQGIREDESDNL